MTIKERTGWQTSLISEDVNKALWKSDALVIAEKAGNADGAKERWIGKARSRNMSLTLRRICL